MGSVNSPNFETDSDENSPPLKEISKKGLKGLLLR